MKQFLFNISEVPLSIKSLESVLSFKPFSNILKRHVSAEGTDVKSQLYNFIIQKFNQYRVLELSVDVGMVDEYKEIHELIYSGMTSETSEETYWALATSEAGTLQDKKILINDLEHLELEELQGVQNLKVIRVSINLNNIS